MDVALTEREPGQNPEPDTRPDTKQGAAQETELRWSVCTHGDGPEMR